MGSAVRMPVPISERCATTVTVPVGSIPRYTLGYHGAAEPSAAAGVPSALAGSTWAASTSAPAENTLPRKPRRLRYMTVLMLSLPRLLDGLADALIRATPADIALHGRIDILVRRL